MFVGPVPSSLRAINHAVSFYQQVHLPMNTFWQPGDHVAYRGIVNSRVRIARPVTVVEDRPERTILLLVPGAQCKFPSDLLARKYDNSAAEIPSRWQVQASGQWAMIDWVWQAQRFLIFMEPGAYYTTNLLWCDETDEFRAWYVNFEQPFRRTPIGFDSLDLELDLVIQADGTQRWKDEAEYHEGIQQGGISAEEVRQIDAAKPIVLERIARKEEPFDTRWLNWMPSYEWAIPELHPEWEQIT